jgi:putative spermidine/putrescine transport system substrate-binding protein
MSRIHLSRGLAVLGLVTGLAACGSDAATDADVSAAATSAGVDCGDGSLEQLVVKAKEDGKVNLIALPPTWANYEGILASFTEKYGIEAPVANPDASSADELTAIRTLRGQADMPEAVDVGPSFTQELVDDGLVDTYRPTTYDEIPASLRDPDGNWVAAYYGVMAIATNATLVDNVPTSWADLEKPEYQGMVTLNGDPREAGAAFAAVMAASVANGGSFDDIMPGIEYFAGLKDSGNLQVVDVSPATLISGEVPIAIDWTYNFPALVPELAAAGFDMQVVVPSDGVYGGYYAQAVVSEASHPCAARLWIEHILSDDGALGYLEGGALPARYASLLDAGLVSEELAANLPSPEIINAISFPSAEQVDAAKTALTDNWGPMVAD